MACAGGAQRVRGGAAAKRRRRRADSGGKSVGEGEEAAIELTVGRFEAEDGRRSGSTERGRSSTRTAMVAATETPESAGEQLEQARDGAEWGRGEFARLWVRGIEAGRRAVAGASNGGDSNSSLLARARPSSEEGEGWKGGESSRARERIRAAPRRRGTPG